MKTLIVFIVVGVLLVLLIKWTRRQILGIPKVHKKLIKGGYEIHPRAMREEERSQLKSILIVPLLFLLLCSCSPSKMIMSEKGMIHRYQKQWINETNPPAYRCQSAMSSIYYRRDR